MKRYTKISLHWITILCLFKKGLLLKCYQCDNDHNPACGVYFKSYQYDATPCAPSNAKCGLQRQPPMEHKTLGNFIGIIRQCYIPGSLPGINDTDGCRYWTSPVNFTALYCFCSTDYCNRAMPGNTFHSALLVVFMASCVIYLVGTSFIYL